MKSRGAKLIAAVDASSTASIFGCLIPESWAKVRSTATPTYTKKNMMVSVTVAPTVGAIGCHCPFAGMEVNVPSLTAGAWAFAALTITPITPPNRQSTENQRTACTA